MSDFFTIVPGGHASPFILHVPHSSRTIPADVRAGMCATDAQLAAELDEITDTATDLIAERAGFDVGVNTPFAGTYIPLEFAANPRVGGIMIEVRKDVYLDAGEGADKGGEYPANGVSHGARRPNHGAIERIAGCIAEMIGRLGR